MIDHTNPLDAFLARQHNQDLVARGIALRDACRTGHGTWQHPHGGKPRSGRDTHLHEINCFGIWASGECGAQAVRNWFTVAYRIHHFETDRIRPAA